MESVRSEQMCFGEKFQKRYEDERQCDEKKGRGLGSETDLGLYCSLSLCVFESSTASLGLRFLICKIRTSNVVVKIKMECMKRA